MAKDKQQKKKDRERRVAKKKLAETAKRRTQEKTEGDSKKTVHERTKSMTPSASKPDFVVSNKKSPFTQRRGGG